MDTIHNEYLMTDSLYRVDTRPITTYKLNINKINTLEDVKKVLDGLCITITLREGETSEMYEKLKDYMD